MGNYMGYPTKTHYIEGEPVEVPDWELIDQPEKAALTEMAERIGYGRCIQILEQLWTHKLMHVHNHNERMALMASGTVCVWCHVDSRTGRPYSAHIKQGDAS